jgi:transcription-repair coupling factor (superfamily II helicase)
MQKVTPHKEFVGAVSSLKQGMEIEPFGLLSRLQNIGYRLENIVEIPGTVSHRGGIIDISPSTSDSPARLEFLGNTIESIRLFDPVSQRSLKPVQSLTIAPATELLTPFINDNRSEVETALNSLDLTDLKDEIREQFGSARDKLLNKEVPENSQFYTPLFHRDSLLDYLPENGLLILDEPQNIRLAIEDFEAKAGEFRADKLARKELPPNFPTHYFTMGELESVMKNRWCLSLTSWGVTGR